MSEQNIIPSVDSSIRLLSLLSKEKFRNATLTQISEELSISKTTCRRILKTFEYQEFVKYDKFNKTYSLGPHLIAIGNRAKELNDYLGIANSILQDIPNDKLVFVLVKRVKDSLVYMGKKEPPLKIRLTVSTGDSFPIAAGAIGKCFFAFLSDKEQNRITKNIYSNNSLPKYTENSITSLDIFNKQIHKIKETGFSESYEEYSEGIGAYAVPIFNKDQEIILVLGAYMPLTFMKSLEIPELKNIMKDTAKQISDAIAHLT